MLGHFDILGHVDRLIGTADTKLVNTPSVRERIEKGKIQSMGRSASLNIETLLAANTDLVLTSSAGISEYDKIEKIRAAAIPVVISAAYMEGHPLARSEWLKFTALFLGEEDLAESVFSEIEERYNRMKAMTQNLETKPSVFMNLPWVALGICLLARATRLFYSRMLEQTIYGLIQKKGEVCHSSLKWFT